MSIDTLYKVSLISSLNKLTTLLALPFITELIGNDVNVHFLSF